MSTRREGRTMGSCQGCDNAERFIRRLQDELARQDCIVRVTGIDSTGDHYALNVTAVRKTPEGLDIEVNLPC